MRQRHHLGFAALGAVLIIALEIFVIAIGAPRWLEILALAAFVVVWLRYRWKYTGWREGRREAAARRRAAALAKRRDRESRKRPRP